jgi:MFS transporter, AAHS family, 4-hydroxybenzoate transporter
MRAKSTTLAEHGIERPDLRVAWLCGLVLLLEGYDIAAAGYAIPSLADVWRVAPSAFTQALAAGNVGLMLGSIGAGLVGDQLGRKPMLISCVAMFGTFSLLSAFAASPFQLAGLRLLTGLGLGGGIPLAIALTSDLARPVTQGRLVMLMSAGTPLGFTLGGLLAGWLVPVFSWPAIFIVGGVLPFVIMPVLALWLPESDALSASTRQRNPVAALFVERRATTTLLLWAMNLLNLVGSYLILLWSAAILHGSGASPSQAIFGASMYATGLILGALLLAPIADHLAVERVLTCTVAFGGLCVLSIGLLDMTFWLLSVIICGAGIGIGGCQAGLNSLSGRIYPPTIRATGAGWALAFGRVGTIAGPLLGGLLLTLGFRAQGIFIIAALPIFAVTILMAILGRLRRKACRSQ